MTSFKNHNCICHALGAACHEEFTVREFFLSPSQSYHLNLSTPSTPNGAKMSVPQLASLASPASNSIASTLFYVAALRRLTVERICKTGSSQRRTEHCQKIESKGEHHPSKERVWGNGLLLFRNGIKGQ